jgi:hypothetical protein
MKINRIKTSMVRGIYSPYELPRKKKKKLIGTRSRRKKNIKQLMADCGIPHDVYKSYRKTSNYAYFFTSLVDKEFMKYMKMYE